MRERVGMVGGWVGRRPLSVLCAEVEMRRGKVASRRR
jgi:hypothetical protein